MQYSSYGTRYTLDAANSYDRRTFQYLVAEGMQASCSKHGKTLSCAIKIGRTRIPARICPECKKVYIGYREFETWKYLSIFRSLISNLKETLKKGDLPLRLGVIKPLGSPDYQRLDNCEVHFLARRMTGEEVAQNPVFARQYTNPLYGDEIVVYFSTEAPVCYMTVDDFAFVVEELVEHVCAENRGLAYKIADQLWSTRRILEREQFMGRIERKLYEKTTVSPRISEVQGIRRRMPIWWKDPVKLYPQKARGMREF